jgi:hypothetical protein
MAMKKKGTMTTKTSVTDNASKKEVLHEEKTEKMKEFKATGDRVVTVKVSDSIKLSHRFQSVGVEVGVELPFDAGSDPVVAAKKGFAIAEELVDGRLQEKVKDLQAFLDQLTSK